MLRTMALLLIAAGLTVALLFQASLTAPGHPHNRMTFQRLQALDYAVLFGAWGPRVGALHAAEKFVHWTRPVSAGMVRMTGVSDAVLQGMALWTAAWFALICLVYLLAFRSRAVFYMFGTYACLSFGYMPGLESRLFAWDMPITFFFALFMAVLVTRPAPAVLTLLIWAAIPFKETAVVLSVYPLFLGSAWTMGRRVRLMLVTAVGAMTLKGVFNLACFGLVDTLPVQAFTGEGSLLGWNLCELGRGLPLLVNAGTLAALLLLPPWRGLPLMGKVVAGLFIAGNFTFGVITEYRIWFEMIPVALYNLEVALLRPPAGS